MLALTTIDLFAARKGMTGRWFDGMSVTVARASQAVLAFAQVDHQQARDGNLRTFARVLQAELCG